MLDSTEALTEHYRALTDDELLGIAASYELTDVASHILQSELARRNLGKRDIADYGEVLAAGRRADQEISMQRTARAKGHLMFQAYLLVIASILLLLLGLAEALRRDSNQGVGVMMFASVTLVMGLAWLGLKLKFYEVLQRRLSRAVTLKKKNELA